MLWIGLSGKIGTGKSFTAKRIARAFEPFQMEVITIPFALALKHLCSVVGDIEKLDADRYAFAYDFFHSKSVNPNTAKDAARQCVYFGNHYPNDPDWTVKNRQLLQYVGTEVVRNMVGIDFWIEHVRREARRIQPDILISDDLRFNNEALAVDLHIGISTYGREGIYNEQLQRVSSGAADQYIHSEHTSEQSLTREPDYMLRVGADDEEFLKCVQEIRKHIVEQ